MAKNKIVFFCKECGYESSKWLGQCPACKEWDTFVEEPVSPKTNAYKSRSYGSIGKSSRFEKREPELLSNVSIVEDTRILTGMKELDRVLGGGIVVGGLVLVGGDPGIGKSTLLLQMCKELSYSQHKVLYVSGEESLKQIKMRAERLGKFDGELLLLSETNLDVIEDTITRIKPEVVIIDSIQTMFKEEVSSAPGSVSQIRETTGTLMHLAKDLAISIFIVGHVTKEGVVAGPRVLEHMVDTVLYFEGDGTASFRILRAVKNRFGSTNEIGVFEMRGNGLAEVVNPSEYMLKGKPEGESGSVVTCLMEGTRPILVEIQALISRTNFNMPRRTAAGMDYNRVNLLMAVIEKRLGVSLADCDAYVNIAGGMRVNEPALDLALIAAILSSYRNLALDSDTIIFGEVGLAGEVRAVTLIEQRVMESAKMGYKRCILPQVNLDSMEQDKVNGMELIGLRNIREILNYM
ncbi:DNA repair protein RadA [Velocimicrobium porci]|uniref:DNA repair protein RadA n=1 Tax=Velocimicrobium porci TaxID=2606634 RepID=A0A6L5XUS0_9FIRM|nr:DNA repair protein RadA [Velocimicrobium porci]MSS62565.1 DNA repair protein RadA [Velocimicrobium porci]